MSKTPKATDGEAPKKRTRKTTIEAETGTKVVKTASKSTNPKAENAATVAAPAVKEVVAAPAAKREVLQMRSLEERIRARAYELYLRRGGQGGSPEQDWFEAAAEVYGESVA